MSDQITHWILASLFLVMVALVSTQFNINYNLSKQNEILERIELCIEGIQLPPQTQPNNQQ